MTLRIAKALCLLVLAACTPLVHAQTQPQVYRCIGAHGEPVFSGQPCGTPAVSSGNATALAGAFGGVCAGSPQTLRTEIAGAFTSRDVKRLSGLILWRGMDQASAQATLRSLSEWLQQPLAGIAIAYAAGPPFADAGPARIASVGEPASAASVVAQSPIGFEVSTGGSDGGTRDFGVTEFGGCWWLTF